MSFLNSLIIFFAELIKKHYLLISSLDYFIFVQDTKKKTAAFHVLLTVRLHLGVYGVHVMQHVELVFSREKDE